MQYNRHYRRSFNQQKLISEWNDIPCSPNYRPANDGNRRRRTRSSGTQQQITVVDQMAAQPHIPYAILPKRFEPKHVPNNGFYQQSYSFSNNYHFYRRPVISRRWQQPQNYYNNRWEDLENNNLWTEAMPSMMGRTGNRRPNQRFGQNDSYHRPQVPIDKKVSY